MVELGRILFVSLTGSSAAAYFRLAVQAINNLMRYLNDPLNFTDSTGQFDEHVFLKVQSAVYLMFADLAALNYTNSAHLQLKATFSFVDKLANLKAHLAGKSGDEDKIFQALLSSKMGATVARILGFHGRKQNDQLGVTLKRASDHVYRKIHSHLAERLPAGHAEDDRLQRLRTFRNMSHGTFLRSQRFEATFVQSAATVPSELMYVPLLLSWGLCLDPKQILEV